MSSLTKCHGTHNFEIESGSISPRIITFLSSIVTGASDINRFRKQLQFTLGKINPYLLSILRRKRTEQFEQILEIIKRVIEVFFNRAKLEL